MPKKIWNKEKVLAELKRWRKNGPKGNTHLDEAARRYFGSLRAALEIAGLPCGTPPPPYRVWSKSSVVAAIRRRKRSGQRLERTHIEDPSLYASSKNFFGAWTKACAAAGYPRPKPEFYSVDEVQLRIIELYERELPLTYTAHKDSKLRRSARKHFGTWRAAVQSLGLGSEMRHKWTDQAIIEAILYRRAASLRLYKTYQEDPALFGAAVKHFGNWQAALMAAGINARVRERWSKERVIERLQELAKSGPCQNTRKADVNLAMAARLRFGTLGKALEVAGVQSLTKRWTDAQIITAIRSRYEAVGPTHLEGLGDTRLAQAARRRFGNWTAAVAAAGLADRITLRNPPKYCTPHDVVAAIQSAHAAGVPVSKIARAYPALDRAARRHFGVWRLAVEAAGLECQRRVWTPDSIIVEIRQRLAVGGSLSSGERTNINLAAAAHRHFGSWTAALKAARVPSKQRKPRKAR